MDPATCGLKKGFYSAITLEQLKRARSSPYKLFPPKNTYLEFDFCAYREPGTEEIYKALEQTIQSYLMLQNEKRFAINRRHRQHCIVGEGVPHYSFFNFSSQIFARSSKLTSR